MCKAIEILINLPALSVPAEKSIVIDEPSLESTADIRRGGGGGSLRGLTARTKDAEFTDSGHNEFAAISTEIL